MAKQLEFGGAPIYSEPIAWQHTVHLDELFSDKGDYRPLIQLLTEASENDNIVFLINSHGGNLDIILPLINMLTMTNAHTTALCSGSQSSAATVFAMYCDDLVALPHSEFMIHELQTGHMGTVSNVSRDVQSTERRGKRLIEETYGGFLTEQEISDVGRGIEIYLLDEEINKRWKDRVEWREHFFSQKQAALQQAVTEAMEVLVEGEEVPVKPKTRRSKRN